MNLDPNLQVYGRRDVVDYYDKLRDLQPCERYVFDRHLKPGMCILDLGVGGGRTTPYLAALASQYVGVDYSADMVAQCRSKFPKLRFEQADAAEMVLFADDSFDSAIFSFNGIDYLPSDRRRQSCLRECFRILRPGGVLIFSVHNARATFVRPSFGGADWTRRIWRTLRAGTLTARLALRNVHSASFWAGEGYILDPVHGGLKTHVGTPEKVIAETSSEGFAFVEDVGGNHPAKSGGLTEPWYYYVFRKPDR